MTSSRSANFSNAELNIMLSALERDRDLLTNVLGKSIKDRAEQAERWQSVADLMNAVGHGTERKGKQVRKKWNELKMKTKKTAADLVHDQTKTGGGEPNYELFLTPLEQRILHLLGQSSYKGCAGMDLDLASSQNSVPKTPSRPQIHQSTPQSSTYTPLVFPQPSTSTPSSHVPQPSTSTPSSHVPQPSVSTPSSHIPQSSCLNTTISSEYNDIEANLNSEANPMPEDYDVGNYLSDINKENDTSWVFGPKSQSGSAGTQRKRNSRNIKRKIFEESDMETKVIETQDTMKNCLLQIKSIGEKQLESQTEVLKALNNITFNQGLILNKLDDLE